MQFLYCIICLTHHRKNQMKTYNPQDLQISIGGNVINGFSFDTKQFAKKWFKVIEANEKTTKLELEDNNFTVVTIELYNSSESLEKILNSEATEQSPFSVSVNNLPV